MPSIAVIGASTDRRKYGNRCVRAYHAQGYTVYPIHPRERTIEGLPTYASILDVPSDKLELVSVYLPAEIGLRVMEEIAQKKVGEVILNPGADDPGAIARAGELGINVVRGCSILMIGADPGC